MKKSKYTLPNFLIVGLLALLQFDSLAQTSTENNKDAAVTIELSIPHGDQLRILNDCSSIDNDVFIIIRNDTDSIVRFYENWNSYGYYNFTFEVKTNDSTYLVSRPHKLWYRNFPTHHSVSPGESIVFQFDLIDSTCAENRLEYGTLENGWIGLPNVSDTALIRVIYSLPSEYESYALPRQNYLDYLDDALEPNKMDVKPPVEENKDSIYLFSETIVSDWRKIIISD
jgi:hypothetical protein